MNFVDGSFSVGLEFVGQHHHDILYFVLNKLEGLSHLILLGVFRDEGLNLSETFLELSKVFLMILLEDKLVLLIFIGSLDFSVPDLDLIDCVKIHFHFLNLLHFSNQRGLNLGNSWELC